MYTQLLSTLLRFKKIIHYPLSLFKDGWSSCCVHALQLPKYFSAFRIFIHLSIVSTVWLTSMVERLSIHAQAPLHEGIEADLLNILCAPGKVSGPTPVIPKVSTSEVVDTVAPQHQGLSSAKVTLVVLLVILLLLPVILIVVLARKRHKHR